MVAWSAEVSLRLEFDVFIRRRVSEFQPLCMKTQPWKFASAAIHVAGYRMPDRRTVDSQLVRPSRHGLELEKGRVRVSPDHSVPGLRMFAVLFNIPSFLIRIAPDRPLDRTVVPCHDTVHQRDVLLLDKLSLKLAGEQTVRTNRFRNDEQPGGLFVEPMHEAGTNTGSTACVSRW